MFLLLLHAYTVKKYNYIHYLHLNIFNFAYGLASENSTLFKPREALNAELLLLGSFGRDVLLAQGAHDRLADGPVVPVGTYVIVVYPEAVEAILVVALLAVLPRELYVAAGADFVARRFLGGYIYNFSKTVVVPVLRA